MKEIKEDKNKWKELSCSMTGIINIILMPILHKAEYRLNPIPINISMMERSKMAPRGRKQTT
jgi:hypothetical protein